MSAPSKVLLVVEAVRSVFEYIQGVVLNFPLQFISPKGDNHPVIIFPGLGAADGSTHFMRSFLTNIGYRVYPWGLGRNLGPRDGLEAMLDDIVIKVQIISSDNNNEKVSLIGWSLGGIYAREVAKRCPDLIRQVITLGTPFKGDVSDTNATFLYEMLSKDRDHTNPDIIEAIGRRPSVPFTSLYSKSDGVVAWQCSIEEEAMLSENIEIPYASHLGLGHNPICMHIIANRLSQSIDGWQHYADRCIDR